MSTQISCGFKNSLLKGKICGLLSGPVLEYSVYHWFHLLSSWLKCHFFKESAPHYAI